LGTAICKGQKRYSEKTLQPDSGYFVIDDFYRKSRQSVKIKIS